MTQVWFPRKYRTVVAPALMPQALALGLALMEVDYGRWIRRWGLWSGAAWAIAVGTSGNGSLVWATVLGVGTIRGTHWLLTHQPLWMAQLRHGQAWLKTPAGQLALAVTTGGLVALGTYGLTVSWPLLDHPVVILALLTQGSLALMILALGVSAKRHPSSSNALPPLDICLDRLANGDRLQQKIALHHLRRYQTQPGLSRADHHIIQDSIALFLELHREPSSPSPPILVPSPLTLPQRTRVNAP